MGFKARKESVGLAAAVDALAEEACACNDLESFVKAKEKLMELINESEEPSKSDGQKIFKSIERMAACVERAIEPNKLFLRNNRELIDRLSRNELPSEDVES